MSARVLVVDDEVIVAETIASTLVELGYEHVRVALSPDEAFACLAAEPADVVLMDVNLAGADGIAAAAVVRERYGLPVVFVTAYGDPATIDRAKGVQTFGFVVKPVSGRDLRVAIEIALFAHDRDRRLAERERELRLTVERLELLMWATDAATWDWEVQTGRTVYSERWAAILGYTLDELQPVSIDTWARFAHPDDLARSSALLKRCFERELGVYDCEARMRHRDGSWVWVLDRGRVVEWDEDSRPVRMVGVHLDITEHKRLAQKRLEFERTALAAQRTESLAVLAGGAAHRFNNLLTTVIGNAEVALGHLPPDSPAVANLADIRLAAGEGAEIGHRLLAYTGQLVTVREQLHLNQLVADLKPSIRRLLPPRVTLATMLAAALPPVTGDPSGLGHLLSSLVSNAAEAIEGATGVISISTGVAQRVLDRPPDASIDVLRRPGPYVFLEVADTGVGIGRDQMDRLFEPFHSTKFVGRGLGLPAVAGIVRTHDGALDVRSAPGRGTRVRVWLPFE